MTSVKSVLIAGFSTRAAAESAARAGFAVTAIDAFADLDRHPAVRALSLPRDFGVRFSARAAARASRGIESDAVVYVSNFENHSAAVRTLATDRALWGNPPDVLQRVRDPILLTEALRRHGLAAPELDRSGRSDCSSRSEWLVKPLNSGGGRGIRPWRGGHVPRGSYLQQVVQGTPGSVVFVAAGGRAVPIGISRQLVGERAFGADGYQYCGSILASAGDEQFSDDGVLLAAAAELASVVTTEFGLVGANGVDFIARGGVPYAIEVNPRWCGSMELVERAYGLSVFGAHAAACMTNALPQFDLTRARNGAGAIGKAIVFAQHDMVVGDTSRWLEDEFVRDIPHPGERIPAGGPICTVFAAGPDSAACYSELVGRAEQVYSALGDWQLGIA